MPRKSSGISITDQFCGAGGSSQAARRLGLDVELAMNHWRLAIETHNTNFPQTEHDCADISASHPGRYWSTNILLTSPECTNHSLAKGVSRPSHQLKLLEPNKLDPKAERSRATMWDVPRFAEYHGYEIIIVENVVDVRKWIGWDAWILAMQLMGYEYETVYLNSQFAHLRPLDNPFFGDVAPQSRDRLYVVFWKKGNKAPDLDIRPLAWCPHCASDIEAIQSWKKKPGTPFWKWGKYGANGQYWYLCPGCTAIVEPYYYAAANVIDWSEPIVRIGDREAHGMQPLKDKTLERIKRGLERYGGQELVLDLAYSQSRGSRSRPLHGPMFTQTGRQTAALCMPFLLGYANGDGPPKPITDPARTFHSANGQALVMPPFLTSVNYFDDRNIPAGEVMATQTTANKYGVTFPPFLVQLRNSQTAKGIDEPLTTITAGGRHHGLLMPFLASYYGTDNLRPVTDPAGTLTGKNRHALVQPETPKVEDCGFRMFTPKEIGRGMAFDDGYVVLGNAEDRVRQYGQAVTPPAMNLLLSRCVESLS